MSGRDLINQMRDGAGVPVSKPPRGEGGVVDLALTLFTLVAVGAVAYFGVIQFFSPPPQPVAAPAPAALSAQVAAVAWTEADAKSCQSRAVKAANAPIPMETAMANPSVTEGYAGLSTRLECQLVTKPNRMCDPKEKAVMVAAVNDYLGRTDLIMLGLGLQGAPMRLLGAATGDGEINAGSSIYDMQKADTVAFMQGYQKRVASALQKLARDGLMAPADFGTFMGVPETITTLFAGKTAQRNVCG